MQKSNQSTRPAGPSTFANPQNRYPLRAPQLSALTRAALAAGVSFDDVHAYADAAARAAGRPVDLPEGLAELATSALADLRLDCALAESQYHQSAARTSPRDTLPASRLWWQGAL